MNNRMKEINRYMVMLMMFCFAVFICCYQSTVRSYNSTMLALSYKYGFTSRSLLGTIYHVINKILPIDMMDFSMTMLFAQIVTGLFFLFLMVFAYLCLRKCNEEDIKPCEYLILFYMIFTVATFSGGYNFFRVDLFMVVVSLLGALLIAEKKAEWLVIPLSALGVMFHQGYVFMYFNIILVLLIYRFLSGDKREKRKYGLLFVLSFVLGSALFLWFEFLSRSNGALYYDTIVDEARKLSLNGQYHSTLLAHEVLGVDLTGSESEMKKINIVEYPIFTVFMLPYIIITIKFFINVFKAAATKVEKFKYLVVLLGAGTMLPDFLLKVDYGRWILAVITYYAVILLMLCMMHDQVVTQQIRNSFTLIQKKPYALLLLVYPMILIPLWDIDINGFLQHISIWLDSHLLHWYQFN